MLNEKDNKSNYITAASVGVSIVTIYVGLISYASATVFRAGYLEYFAIDIRVIDYRPSVVEFMADPILTITSIVILLVMFLVSALLANGLFWALKSIGTRMKWRFLVSIVSDRPFPKVVTIALTVALFIVSSFKIALFDSSNRGYTSAEQQRNFTVLVTEDDRKQALIYQFNGIGLFKTYNADTKAFDTTYETIEITGKKFEFIQLITE